MTDQPRNPTYPDGPGPSRPDQLTRFFDWIRRSGMVRGRDRWFAGVCGAIAGRTGLDPIIVRGIAVVLAVLGAPVLFAYAVGWALLPNELGRIHAEEALRGRFEPAIIAIGAVLLLTIVPFTRGFWWDGPPAAWGMPGWLSTSLSAAWGLAIVAGIVWLVLYLVRRGRGTGGSSGTGGTGGTAGTGFGFGSGERPRPTSGYGSAADAGATAPAPGAPPAPPVAPSSSAAASSATPSASATATATENPYQADYRNRNGNPTANPGAHPGASAYPGGQGSTGSTASTGAPTSAGNPNAAHQSWQEQNRVRAEQNRAWSEQNLAWQERERRRQAERAAWRRGRRPSAALSAITLGLALLAGAITASVYAHGIWSNSAFALGLAVALGVAAIGMIVSGIRGRRTGALGGLAFLAALALVTLGWMPQGTQFDFAGTHRWTVPSSSVAAAPGYAMFAGTPTVDLTALDSAPANTGRTIDVWLGFGVTTLVLPSDRPVEVEVNLLAGFVTTGEATTGGVTTDPERGGVFIRDVRTVNGTDARAVTHIRVWSFAGQVDLTQSDARVGIAR